MEKEGGREDITMSILSAIVVMVKELRLKKRRWNM